MDRFHIEKLVTHGIGPVDLSVGRDECVGITGRSGTGKTLLLRALADMEPHSGQIFFDGAETGSMSGPEWRSRVGMLPAESSWWFDTVGEHFDSIEEEKLKSIGFVSDTLNWEVNRLSSGERQRLAVLRLFENRPRVLLLDEPTANLDSENVFRVEEFIKNYRKENEAAVIWVGHDIDQLKRVSSRSFMLDTGRLKEIEGGE